MKLRMATSAGLATLTLLGGGLMTTSTAQATTTANECVGWIDGEWGHGKCTATNWSGGGNTMKLDVVCDAWWDADVHLEAYVRNNSTVELQGHCDSSVVSSSAYWK